MERILHNLGGWFCSDGIKTKRSPYGLLFCFAGVCYNADMILAGEGGSFADNCSNGSTAFCLACFYQSVGCDFDGGRQKPCQARRMARTGKEFLFIGFAGGQRGVLGRYVSVPAQSTALVFCARHARNPDFAGSSGFLAVCQPFVKNGQNNRAFIALAGTVCYTE